MSRLEEGANNTGIKLDQTPGDEQLRMAIFYTKSIYQPKNNQYFVSNAEIEIATEVNLKKFGFDAIEKLYHAVRDTNQLGMLRRKWTVNSIEEDIYKVTGLYVEQEKVKSGITEQQQICIYIHILYAPNIPGEWVLEQEPIDYLVNMSKQKNISLNDLECLMDYAQNNRSFKYGRSVANFAKDLKDAKNYGFK
jgi:hypothetical protein